MRSGLGCELMRAVSRFAIVGVVGGLAAGCSTDSVRFSENPFSNPFASSGGTPEPSMTGSVDERPAATARVPRTSVRSEPLAPVRSAAVAQPIPSRPATERTASGAGWSAAGGTDITVGSGDTLTTISNRYGVPPAAILSANGVTASQVVTGRRLVIPVYSASGGAAPARTVQAAPPQARTVQAAPAPAQGRVVASTRLPAARPAAPTTVAEAATPKPRVRPGQPVARAPEPVRVAARPESRVPTRPERAAPQPVAKVASKPEPKAPPAKVVAKVVAKVEPARKVEAAPQPKVAAKAASPVEQPKVAAAPAKPMQQAEVAKPAAREPEATGAIPAQQGSDFRWPARGRVISGFGNAANEGINIAVPDGTPVKAAGDGVVAYAGSEVKGYGNLVLIRHDNGYVSAYAHNGDLDVKRGQKVARGQTIAKSGQSGNVTSPQLHFEIRKGSTPVDPMRHLASAN